MNFERFTKPFAPSPATRSTVVTRLGLVLIIGLAMLASAPLLAEEAQTLTGEYHWEKRDVRGGLEAIFTPTGEGTWDVSFHFEFRGEPHTYTGTAEGSLENGALEGTVKNENKKRTFTFEGTSSEGKFEGTHAELEGGKVYDTGTLTLGS